MSRPKMYPPQFVPTDLGPSIAQYQQLMDEAERKKDFQSSEYYKQERDNAKKKQKGDEGEKFVFDTLRSVLPDDWIVFHSCVLFDFELNGDRIDYRRAESYNTEMDFVLINPSAGVLVLEVKNWAEKTAEINENNQETRDPITQAADAARTLKKWLTEKYGLNIPQCTEAAWMTSGNTETQRRNPKYMCGEETDREKILSWLNSQFRQEVSPEIWDVQKTEELLAHAERYRISLQEYDRIMDHATAKINNLLPMLSKSRVGIAVEGCAGSGKTVMAVREASRLATSGKRVLYVCYTANLPAWLQKQYKDLLKDVTVQTFHAFCKDIINQYCDDKAIYMHWKEIVSKIEDNPDALQYDYIFVDEAQDFQRYWWKILEAALRNKRKNNPNAMFYLFFDKNQELRNASNPPPLPVKILLNTNLRNSAEIAKFSSAILPNEDITPLDLSCHKVAIHSPEETLAGRNAKIRELIKELVSDADGQGFSMRDIVVLSPYRSAEGTCFTDPGIKDLLSLPVDTDKYRIQNCLFGQSPQKALAETILRFKGLEAPVIILTDVKVPVDAEGQTRQRGDDDGTFTCNSFYVACTRAKYALHIIPVDQAAADFAKKILAQAQ